MSFQLPTKTDILNAINTANNISLKMTDIVFSTPQVVAGSWRDQQTDKNSVMRVSAAPESNYQGSAIQLYDRLSLSSLAFISGFKLVAPDAQTTHDLLANIKIFTGVEFTVDDLENLPITTVDNKRTAVLSAKPGSLGWVGNISLEVKEGGILLSDVVSQSNLPGLKYPNEEAVPGVDTMGSIYLYGYDFTKYNTDLIGLVSGVIAPADATKLVDMLKVVDISAGKTLWNNDASSTEWSLEGATITRNGLNNTSTLPTNPAYKYVLGITLKPSVTTPKGVLYLHYNDPFNPNDF